MENVQELPTPNVLVFKAKNADGSPRQVSVYMPTVNEIVSGMQGQGALKDYALKIFTTGWVGTIRNDIAPNKDGTLRYPVPTSIADFIANQEAKEVSKSRRGEGLKIRRASLDAFCQYLLEQGVIADGIVLIRRALKDNDTLTARVDLHDHMEIRLEAWAATLDDTGMIRNKVFLEGCINAMAVEVPEDAYGTF